eukprot:6192202-Pleurochrysis_carterae.AAC.1
MRCIRAQGCRLRPGCVLWHSPFSNRPPPRPCWRVCGASQAAARIERARECSRSDTALARTARLAGLDERLQLEIGLLVHVSGLVLALELEHRLEHVGRHRQRRHRIALDQ